MLTIYSYATAGHPAAPVIVAVRMIDASIAAFTLYRTSDGAVMPIDPPGSPSDRAQWTLDNPGGLASIRYDLNVTPGGPAATTSDAFVSLTQGNHVLQVQDANLNQISQPVRLRGTASGGDGIVDFYLNYV